MLGEEGGCQGTFGIGVLGIRKYFQYSNTLYGYVGVFHLTISDWDKEVGRDPTNHEGRTRWVGAVGEGRTV